MSAFPLHYFWISSDLLIKLEYVYLPNNLCISCHISIPGATTICNCGSPGWFPMGGWIWTLWGTLWAFCTAVKTKTHIFTGKFNTLRLKQDGRHFTDYIFKSPLLKENYCKLIKLSLKFVPRGLINNTPALVQIIVWRRTGPKSLLEPTGLVFWRICASPGVDEYAFAHIDNACTNTFFAVNTAGPHCRNTYNRSHFFCNLGSHTTIFPMADIGFICSY